MGGPEACQGQSDWGDHWGLYTVPEAKGYHSFFPGFTHCSGPSRPAPPSSPRPPAPSERPQSHLGAAGCPGGDERRPRDLDCSRRGPWRSSGPSLTRQPIRTGARGPTWALQNLFISSSLARRSRVRRQVGYLSNVPEFLAKVSRAYGRVRPSGAGPRLLVDGGWGRLGWKWDEFW